MNYPVVLLSLDKSGVRVTGKSLFIYLFIYLFFKVSFKIDRGR